MERRVAKWSPGPFQGPVREESGAAPAQRSNAEVQESLAAVTKPITRSVLDWVVTEDDASESLALVEQQHDAPLLEQLSKEGWIERMLDNLPEEAVDNPSVDLLLAMPERSRADWIQRLGPEASSKVLAQVPWERMDELVVTMPYLSGGYVYRELWSVEQMMLAEQHHDAQYEPVTDADAVEVPEQKEHRTRVRGEQREHRNRIRKETMLGSQRELMTMPYDSRWLGEASDWLTETMVEREYGVNLLSEDGGQWTDSVLSGLWRTFAAIPDDHLRDNPALTKFVRAPTFELDSRASGAYNNANGAIGLFDRATDKSQVLAHEVGHAVANAQPELFETFREISGWSNVEADALSDFLAATGLNPELLESTVEEIQRLRLGQSSLVGDQRIGPDFYSDGYVSRDALAIPRGRRFGGLDWAYAATHPSEHFAELYGMAVTNPKMLYRELVSFPEDTVAKRLAEVEAASALVDEARDLPDRSLLEERLRALLAAESELEQAERIAQMRGDQHAFMREQVFGLESTDSYPEQVAMTPAQLRSLQDG